VDDGRFLTTHAGVNALWKCAGLVTIHLQDTRAADFFSCFLATPSACPSLRYIHLYNQHICRACHKRLEYHAIQKVPGWLPMLSNILRRRARQREGLIKLTFRGHFGPGIASQLKRDLHGAATHVNIVHIRRSG
jgi:hypothetical protein